MDNLVIRRIEVKQLDYGLSPVGGLALVGHYLKALTPQWARLDGALPVRGGVSNSDVVRSYLGLLATMASINAASLVSEATISHSTSTPSLPLLPSSAAATWPSSAPAR